MRAGREQQRSAEVNALRFEVARLKQQAAEMAELLEIERARCDMWERMARFAWASRRNRPEDA